MTQILKFQPAACGRRRALLGGIATLGVAALAMALPGGRARAQTHFEKSAVQYQDSPKDGKSCSRCLQFIPGAAPGPAATCRVVAGEVGPTGYCLAFTRRPNS